MAMGDCANVGEYVSTRHTALSQADYIKKLIIHLDAKYEPGVPYDKERPLMILPFGVYVPRARFRQLLTEQMCALHFVFSRHFQWTLYFSVT